MNNEFSRARFLRLLIVSLAATAIPRALAKDKKIDLDAIVIGAGIAGLAAARELAAAGKQVLILEGRDRLGGRIWTDKTLSSPLDLGASWIQGTKNNPLTDLTSKFKIDTIKTNFDNSVTYDCVGKEIAGVKEEKMESEYKQLLKEINQLRKSKISKKEKDISLQEAVKQILSQKSLKDSQLKELNFNLNIDIEHEYAADLNNISLFHWDSDEAFGGDSVIFLKGYDQIIQKLAKDLNLKLNHIVQKIEWEKKVKVTTNKGTFEAAKVIITVPLGVLKAGKIKFIPELPERKRLAIKRLEMGILNKVYLKFSKVFWDETHFIYHIPNKKGEWTEWLNLERFIKQPILLAFNSGSYAKSLEGLTDKKIVEGAMKVLRELYGQAINPKEYLITRWGKDPFSYGSYSHSAPGSIPEDYDALAEPVSKRLFFAGEATSRQYPGSAHGAFLSGKKAALLVLKM
jgi:monoamine oxidase